jgi:glycosyltransferase involved in cell wall biosynthesis
LLSAPLRITFLLTQSLDSPSGLGRYWPLAKEMTRLGHKITILALHPDFRAAQTHHFFKDDVEVYYVGQMHVRKVGNTKIYFNPVSVLIVSVIATFQLLRYALQVPTDVYQLCKPHPMNGLAVLLASWIRRKPVYLDCDDYEATSNRFANRWQQVIVRLFEDGLPRIAQGITVNTQFTARRLRELICVDVPIVYVPNGVDRQRFAQVPDVPPSILKAELGLTDGVVVYVGSMSLTSHAVDLLLDAFVYVRRRLPTAKLVLVGGGEDFSALKHYAIRLGLDDSVVFVGRVAPHRVSAYYAIGDVSVDPVRDTPGMQARSPLKVIESLVCGVPVVTSDIGDRAVQLAEGGGLLVPPADAASLGDALGAMLENDDLRRRLSLEATSVGAQYYWDELVRDFMRVYRLESMAYEF